MFLALYVNNWVLKRCDVNFNNYSNITVCYANLPIHDKVILKKRITRIVIVRNIILFVFFYSNTMLCSFSSGKQ